MMILTIGINVLYATKQAIKKNTIYLTMHAHYADMLKKVPKE